MTFLSDSLIVEPCCFAHRHCLSVWDNYMLLHVCNPYGIKTVCGYNIPIASIDPAETTQCKRTKPSVSMAVMHALSFTSGLCLQPCRSSNNHKIYRYVRLCVFDVETATYRLKRVCAARVCLCTVIVCILCALYSPDFDRDLRVCFLCFY